MTHDPPETRATLKDVLAEAERQGKGEIVFENADDKPPCHHGVWDVLEGGKRLRCHYCGIDKEKADMLAAAEHDTLGRVDWGRVPELPPWQIAVEHPSSKPARDPSNLNDPALQRWVVAFAWLLTLVLLGTCVAGGACLLGAFRGDAESEP